MRRLPALFLVLLATVTAGAGCGQSSEAGPDGRPAVVPGPGQAFVTGTVDRFRAQDAVLAAPLPTPFTLSSLQRGAGGATIENAVVGGRRSTISWGTGTPLPINGAGGLDLGPIAVEADRGGVTWKLDGAARTFVPGSYRAAASVAVGSGGLAAPREAVDFQAGPDTVLSSHGGVVIHFDPRRVDLKGPGKISVSGRLRVQIGTSSKEATSVSFGPGPFTVTLSPAAGGYTIDSVLQGKLSVT